MIAAVVNIEHTALRDLTSQPVFVDRRDVAPDIAAERAKMLAFAEDVREGRVLPGRKGSDPAARIGIYSPIPER